MSKNYTLFHVHSYYSILDGYGTPKQNVERAKKLGMHTLGISDHGTIAGCIQHWEECKKAGIKPSLGIELYICNEPAIKQDATNRSLEHFVIWAKNKTGWENILKLVSQTNDPSYFYYKPRIQLFDYIDEEGVKHPGLESFVGPEKGIQGFNGHQGTRLSNILFADPRASQEEQKKAIKVAYGQYKESPEYYKKFLQPNWLKDCSEMALKMEAMFGKGNFFIELQNELNTNDKIPLLVHPVIVDCLREVSKATGIPACASGDPHYPSPEDAIDQRAMVMINMRETEESVQEKLEDPEEMDLMVFFGSESFYIKPYEEMTQKFTKEELEMTNKIAEGIESFNITSKPLIPKYPIPKYSGPSVLDQYENESDKFLMHLCIRGASNKKPWEQSGKSKSEYWERLQSETDVIFRVGLSDYFLVVWDICQACDYRPADHSYDWITNLKNGGNIDPIARGVGRGSAAGCLTSYLIGITGIDPIPYDLLFSRFYNEGRNRGDYIELADIDLDLAAEDREWVVQYLSDKYGAVYPMVTFGKMQGRAALKDIFRIKGIEDGFDIANEICKNIPDQSLISSELQEMKDSGEEDYGIIRWAIDNSEEVRKYYEDENFTEIFDQAMRNEGKIRSQGRHASGYVLLGDNAVFPMAFDPKEKQRIIGVDMRDAEKIGGVKLDLLGISTLDKLKMCQDLVNSRGSN